MALSDSPSRQGVKIKKVKTTKSWYTDKQKLETVQSYMLLGNLAMTARVLKIPEETVRHWKASTWWREIEGELKIQDEMQLSARLKNIMEKSLEVTEERLENGDYVYNQKTGAIRRKPVNMKDAHKVSMDLIDKRNMLLNKNVPAASDEQMTDKLAKMMLQFADFAKNQLSKSNTIEAEDAQVIEESSDVENEMVSDDQPSSEVWIDDEQEAGGDILPEEENRPT